MRRAASWSLVLTILRPMNVVNDVLGVSSNKPNCPVGEEPDGDKSWRHYGDIQFS